MPESLALQQFRAIVLGDAALQQELRRCSDRSRFVALVCERANARGCEIAAAEVEAALAAAAKAWFTRWVGR
jgi:predicted MarR family transcription regulator